LAPQLIDHTLECAAIQAPGVGRYATIDIGVAAP